MANIENTKVSGSVAGGAVLPHDAAREPEAKQAAERVATELAKLADDAIQQVSLDIPGSVALALGVWTRFQPFVEPISKLPGVDANAVRKLRDYTLALYYWQGNALFASVPTSTAPAMVEKGYALRERTLDDLRALAAHGFIEASMLSGFGGTNSYRKLGQDLQGLSNLVHQRWASIQGRSALTLEAMDELAALGQSIMQAVGDQSRSTAETAEATRMRDKAYTLFVRSYDEARRAMQYLRWHEGDADEILPSLYAGRRGSKKADAESASVAAVAAAVTPAPRSSLIDTSAATPANTHPSSEPFAPQ